MDDLLTTRIIANLTTYQYIEYENPSKGKKYIKSLVTPLKKNEKDKYNGALIKEDVNESSWKRTDKIVLVPSHLEKHVEKNYGKLYM